MKNPDLDINLQEQQYCISAADVYPKTLNFDTTRWQIKRRDGTPIFRFPKKGEYFLSLDGKMVFRCRADEKHTPFLVMEPFCPSWKEYEDVHYQITPQMIYGDKLRFDQKQWRHTLTQMGTPEFRPPTIGDRYLVLGGNEVKVAAFPYSNHEPRLIMERNEGYRWLPIGDQSPKYVFPDGTSCSLLGVYPNWRYGIMSQKGLFLPPGMALTKKKPWFRPPNFGEYVLSKSGGLGNYDKVKTIGHHDFVLPHVILEPEMEEEKEKKDE